MDPIKEFERQRARMQVASAKGLRVGLGLKLVMAQRWSLYVKDGTAKARDEDYDAIKDTYDPFLIKMTTERQDWKIETDPEEEETLAKITYGAIAAVMAIPVAFGVFLAAR